MMFFFWLGRGKPISFRCGGLVLGSVTCQRGYTIDIHLKWIVAVSNFASWLDVSETSWTKLWENLHNHGWSTGKYIGDTDRPFWLCPKIVDPMDLHPWSHWSLTWHLKISPWKRRFLLETIISRFHAKLWGVPILKTQSLSICGSHTGTPEYLASLVYSTVARLLSFRRLSNK